ncbi:glutamate synthase (NADPH/NADH) small chain [Pontibacter ummariensis]|uniref:Glutamate synthase (NADPH/NADH) small chain n=1 Tax=Pontibacter ummariensis TaxID=1610492 RepID=A0A239KYV1_9BACT|nr:glutamate synthase subunit beta [Pontibacter ummariensis]PRY04659.1 glutamate synthase (NADPH/NADH) small chain [Pontibacter ummariensis]SNT23205.1 glutamate synthase (NADPH/NADH) small chain [Pontibacter ummariensis]
MGKVDGFLTYDRELPQARDPKERINDSNEIYTAFPEEKTKIQASRCMDCGVPFCHNGCPLGNMIPDFNDAVYDGEWEQAAQILYSTNNFPEFTGRICPAPCESSCVLSINKPAVAIEHIEKAIAEKSFELGLVKPRPPKHRTGKKVAVIGSGPAGLAAAAQLNQAGHKVDVYDKADKAGGLLRYGIPDFKLEKWTIDRRLDILKEEGIRFHLGVEIGKDVTLKKLHRKYDAVLLAIGSTKPRVLDIPGNHLKGIHFAMDYLTLQNQKVAGETIPAEEDLDARDKHVLVIGGGDTGSDCVGTANRQFAKSITQLQYRNMPSTARTPENPWPEWPMTYTSSSSHEEGCERSWGWLTKEFVADENGNVKGLKVVELEWKNGREYTEKPDSEKVLPCDLAMIAIGYERPEHDAFQASFDFKTDKRGNFKLDDWQTNVPGIFAAGDACRGQSLVVWAISDGREAARAIDLYLMKASDLPSKELSKFVLNKG